MSFLEVPIFRGEEDDDLRQWISEMEYEFQRWNFTDSEKLNLANAVIDGKAYIWFLGIQLISWEDLRNQLLMKYGEDDDPETIKLRIESDRCVNGDSGKRHSESVKIQTKIIDDETTLETVARSESIQGIESQEATSSILEIDFPQPTILQVQVPISDWESSHRKDLLGLLSTTVIVETQIDDDLGEASWDYLNASMDQLQSHSSLKSVNDKHNAHELFERMPLRKRRLHHKRKLSLSPKSWMFKFKNMNLQRCRSQMNPYQAFDRSIVRYAYPYSNAQDGSMWKGNNVNYWRMMRQPHISRLRCKNELWQHSQDSELLKEESSELFFHHSVASSYGKIEHAILRPKWVFTEDSPRCLTLFLSHGFDPIYNPASEYNNAADVFQFLKDTTSATSKTAAEIGLCLSSAVITVFQQAVLTEIFRVQKPWLCIAHGTKSTDSHLWHRWKIKSEILQKVSELMLTKVVLFQLQKEQEHGFSGFVREYKEELAFYLVIVEGQNILKITLFIPEMKFQQQGSSTRSFAIILLRSSLRSSFISTEGVYKSISTCLIMVDVQLWLLSTGSEFEVLKRNDRNQGKKKSLFTHLLHILIQQEKKWKRLYKSRMFKYKGGRLDTKLVRQSQKSRDRAPLAFKWEGVLDSVSAAIDRSWK